MAKEIKDVAIRDALKTILEQEPKGNMVYAQKYAKAALELGGSELSWLDISDKLVVSIKHKPTGKMMKGMELKTQLLYVLSNLTSWKGQLASQTKKVLAKAAK